MFVSIEKPILGSDYPHQLVLVSETARDRNLLQRLIDSYNPVGCGIDPETNEPINVSIVLEAGK